MSTPEQAKALLSEVVSRGARKRIAQHLGIAESDLSRRFSVNDERKSGIGEALREVSAIAAEDSKAFPKVKAYLQSFLEALEPSNQAQLPLPLLLCQANKEAGDVFEAVTMGWSDDEVVRQAAEAVAAFQRIIAIHIERKPNHLAVPRKSQRLRRTG